MRSILPFLLLLQVCWLLPGRLPAQIVNIEEQRITGTTDSTHWYGYLRGSAALTKVKQQSLQLQVQSKMQFKRDPHLTLLLLNLNLLRAGGNDFTRQAFAHLRYNYKISAAWTWEAFAQLQTSPLQLLRQRSLVGTGPRFRLLKSKDGRQRMYLGAAWLWEQNRFAEPAVTQSWHRSSNYVSTTFRLGKQHALIGTTYWQPVWGLIRNYRLSTEWLLKIGLTKKLSLTIDVSYSIDKNLPPGAPASTYAWLNGIAWQL
ncbi:MAG: DUF481 domain-containing protein [Saprospirales bacterium]|nr:DUF481 domain-containing protein [Saprospirales bacterium]